MANSGIKVTSLLSGSNSSSMSEGREWAGMVRAV